MKIDYPEFNKREIIVINVDGSNSIEAIVVDCNYHVGITIVNKEDKDHIIVCLNRKQVLSGKMILPKGYTYRQYFYHIVKCIRTGKYTLGIKYKNNYTNPPDKSNCPWGQ